MGNFKLIEEKLVYENQYNKLYENTVLHPDGEEHIYLVKKNLPAVAIIALDKKERILFIKEDKYLSGKSIITLPLGAIETGETAKEAACKELKEEGGCEAKEFEFIGEFMIGASRFGMINLFIARHVQGIESSDLGTSDEVILDKMWLTKKEVLEKIKTGEIDCGMVMACLMKYYVLGNNLND